MFLEVGETDAATGLWRVKQMFEFSINEMFDKMKTKNQPVPLGPAWERTLVRRKDILEGVYRENE